MDWSVRREDLFEALDILALVPSKSGVPSSDYFLVEPDSSPERLKFSTAAGMVAEVWVEGSGKWPYQKPFYLARSVFTPFVAEARELTNKFQFEFSLNDSELILKHGRRTIKLNEQPSVLGFSSLGKLQKPSKILFNEDVIGLMDCAASCAASELKSPHLACVYLSPIKNGIEILSTNEPVILRMVTECQPVTEILPFPISMLSVLRSKELKSLKWANGCIVGSFARGIVWQTVSQDAQANFPAQELRETLERTRKSKFKAFSISAYQFAKLIERLSHYLQYVSKENWVVQLSGAKGSRTLQAICRLPYCTIEESTACLQPLERDVQFDWPLYLLAPVFQYIGKEEEERSLEVRLDEGIAHVSFGNLAMCISLRMN